MSATTPPGDDTGWFWSFDCASECNHSIVNVDVGVTLGRAAGHDNDIAFAAGVGWSGIFYPYADGYVQLRAGRNPYGVGARVGLPVTGWNDYQIYGRYDVPLESGGRILLNPGVFYHAGNSPNGQNPGQFLAIVQGIGYMIQGQHGTFIPAASFVVGRGSRESYSRANRAVRHGVRRCLGEPDVSR